MEERSKGRAWAPGVSPARAIAALVIAAACSFGLSAAISAAQDHSPPDSEPIGVEWANRPANLGALIAASQAVVLARVERVEDGEPLILAPATQDEPALSAPTERIALSVEETVAGEAPAKLTLFKLGGPGAHPDGSPAYAPGERYLLFVRERLDDEAAGVHPDGTWIAAAPDGRLLLGSAGRLTEMIEGPISQQLGGLTLSEAAQRVDAAREPATDPIEAGR